MTIQRENVIRGPGSVTLNATQIFDKDGVTADIETKTFDEDNSAYGVLDTRRSDVVGKVAFRPCGAITAAVLSVLYPHGTPSIGSSLLGATDVPCTVHSLTGTKLLFPASALTKMPSLKLSSLAGAFSGQAEVTCLRKNNTAPTTDNSLYTVSTEQWAGAFDVANIKGGVYSGVWGSGGTAVTFKTNSGWEIDFEMGVEEQYCEGVGTYDIMLTGVTVRAKCVPLEISESTLLGYLNAQGANAVLGGSMRSSKDLVIACTGALTVTLKEVALVKGPLAWGANKLRIGEIGFVAHRAITGGVPAALFSVAMTA